MTVSQDVLVQFGRSNVMVGIAGYYVSSEGTQHVIVGFRDGTLTEVYWKSGQGVHQDVLANFADGIADVGGYFVPIEGTQHAIAGIRDGSFIEVYNNSKRDKNND